MSSGLIINAFVHTLQDGMLYLFNLPGRHPAAAAAAETAASSAQQPAAAAGRAAVGAPVPGSELMVRGLPDWEPLSSQIFRRFVEAVMSTLEEQQQQCSQRQPMEADAGQQQSEATEQQQQQQDRSAAANAAAAAIAAVRRALVRGDARQRLPADSQQQQPQELWMAGEMSSAMRDAPGSVAQAEAAIAAGERLLEFAVLQLAESCAAAAELKPKFQFGSRERQHRLCSWQERARHVAHLLQVRLCWL
jgi:hypothetical protein